MKRHFGLSGVDIETVKRGYFPKGGGEIRVTVSPFTPLDGSEEDSQGPRNVLRGIQLVERGAVVSISGIAHLAGLPINIGKEMVAGAQKQLQEYLSGLEGGDSVPIDIHWDRQANEKTAGAGSGIVLWAELEGGGMIGGSSVGEKRKKPRDVGVAAAAELIKGLEDGGCVDEVRR
jgi:RNA 3'-terminal phosphate cyclase (ATP)